MGLVGGDGVRRWVGWVEGRGVRKWGGGKVVVVRQTGGVLGS